MENKGETIDKAVEALALIPQKSTITRLGRQIYNAMLRTARVQAKLDPLCQEFRAPLNDLLRSVSLSADVSPHTKQLVLSMMTTAVQWQSPSEFETPDWEAVVLLAQASLKKRDGQMWLTWGYAPLVREALMAPQRWARLRMSTISKMRSHAALALYEICVRYQDSPGRLSSRRHWTWWLPVLTGVPSDGSKTEYRFFKRDYLNRAVGEINKESEITVELLEFKLGRSIADIQFRVTKKPGAPQIDLDAEGMDGGDPYADLIARAMVLGVTDAKAQSLIDRHGGPALEEGLNVLQVRKEKEQIKSPGAYLTGILSHAVNHAISAGSTHTADSNRQVPLFSTGFLTQEAWVAKERQQKFTLAKEKESELIAQKRQQIREMTEADRIELLQRVRRRLQGNPLAKGVLRRIDQDLWQSPIVMAEMVKDLKD